MNWNIERLRNLISILVQLGGVLTGSGSANIGAEFAKLKSLTGWKQGQNSGWVDRSTSNVEPEIATRPLRRLLWRLLPLFSSPTFHRDKLMLDLGQAVWDLRPALSLVGIGLHGWETSEINRMWHTRPELSHLKQIHIENFRCLKRMDAPLKPLTVLIGTNDSGKSTFLAALEMLVNGGVSIQRNDRWRGDEENHVLIQAETTAGRIALSSSGDRNMGTKVELQPACRYQFPSKGVVMTSDGVADDHGVPAIGSDGTGVPALFDYLLRQHRSRFFAATEALVATVPGLLEINIGTPAPAQRRIDLVLEGGFRLPAEQASAGVRLMLTFVALAFHPTPPQVILLEEPESGVHPRRLAEIVRLLEAITEGRHGERAAQVIMTTHSPYLLDCIDIDRHQVIVFKREEDGSRTGQAADKERLKIFLDEFKLGEVWYNEGEEGMLKKS